MRNPAFDLELRRALALSRGESWVGSDGGLVAPPLGWDPRRGFPRDSMGADPRLPPYLASVTATADQTVGGAGKRWMDIPQLVHKGGPLDSAGILNTGRVVDVLPAQFGGGINAGLGEPGPEVRLLELSGLDREAQAITIFFASLPFNDTAPPNNLQTLINGPMIGIVDFAVGGGNFTRLEVDLPLPKPWDVRHQGALATNTFTHQADGLSVTIPCSSVIASVRLDSKVFIVNGTGTTATIANSAFGTRNNRMRALAYAAYNFAGKGFSLLRRTVYLTNANFSLAAGATVNYGLPNFAKRVFFHRFPLDTTTISVSFPTSFYGPLGTYILGPGDIGPIELVPGMMAAADVTNSGAVGITNIVAEHVLEV